MPKEILSVLLTFEVIVLIFSGLTFFYLFMKYYQKQLEQQKKLTLMEQSNRLIETIYSERREYQNNIQVMKIMVAMGVTQELEAYITKLIANMIKAGGITRINDPILAATIISHQVKAKEYNVAILVNCNKQFNNLDRSLELGELFNIFLEILIENILTTRNSAQAIIINIDEDQTGYSFEFKTDDTALIDKNTPLNPFLSTLNHPEKLAAAKKIIKELNGSFYSVINNDRIFRLKVIIHKNRNTMRQFISVAN